ncbi:MAG: hypothetical protein CVU46_13190 [Chloroflexi bacterium HGW-Chloroflexi-8]|nr:MAG: hypothetical protein CVU46_13190 [Chloroflexi bacterium HGW-Chloroflexi-8]
MFCLGCSASRSSTMQPNLEVPHPNTTLTKEIPTELPTSGTVIPIQTSAPVQSLEISPTPYKSSCLEKGTISHSEIMSPALNETLTYFIYFPPCYDADFSPGYPLLVLMHGQIGDPEMWIKMGITEKADNLILNGTIPPLIIAFPFEKRYLIDSRDSNYDQAIIEDFMPNLLKNYAVNTDRAQHAIGGLSRGANWAFQIGMSNPELFGAIGAHSFTTFGNEVPKLSGWIDHVKQIGSLRLTFDIGEKDPYKKYWDAFISDFLKYDFPFDRNVSPGEHNTIYWQSHLQEYLLWYSTGWGDSINNKN